MRRFVCSMSSWAISTLRTLSSYASSALSNERGLLNLLPWLLGLTAILNIGHRQRVAAETEQVMGEELFTPEQVRGSVVQGFANRGLSIGPQSPAVLEAIRRQSLARRQQQAQTREQRTFSGPDPLSVLFGLFTQH